MKKNSDRKYGSVLIFISGIIFIISEFIEIISNFSAYEFVQLINYGENYDIYLFPLISGIILLVIPIFLSVNLKKLDYFSYFCLIFVFNLMLFFIIELLEQHGSYVWQYGGFYYFLAGIMVLLFGLMLLFAGSHQSEIPEKIQ